MASLQEEETPPDKDSTPGTDEAVAELKQVCQEKWEVVKTNHQLITKNGDPKAVGDHSPLLAILQEKEKRVKGEIETIKKSKPSVLPENPDILREVLRKDLAKSISQLQEVFTLVKSQKKELTQQISREEEIQRQLQSVHNCLEIKLEGIANNDEEEVTMSSVMTELDIKIRKGETMNRSLTKRLVHFVNEHFPLPSVEEVKAGKKKLRSSDKKISMENLVPFKVVLQELMNKCIDEPHDPYVIITNRFWPPYIELLLRCQIVLRHPEDDQRIKLVPFHL
ncbi:centromere protein K-like [Haliotis rubra]|uniref:centromere protein K-like n=1 Tax=Haliotis rubra TaxID=36100 RepID=UPI001EE62A3C|nr:centromere protein K-like [Haliotis rubra]